MIVGIISYLPDTRDRIYRLLIHKFQLEWLRKHFPSIEIIVAQRGYNEDDFQQGIHYIPAKIGVAGARNSLLEYFYQSNEDFMLMMDDDIILYDYYDGINLINEIHTNPYKFSKLDCVNSINPTKAGFKKAMIDSKELVELNYTFIKPSSKQVQFALYKNFKKYYDKEPYFLEQAHDFETNYTKLAEDYIFIYELLLNNYNVFSCRDWIQKGGGGNISTISPEGDVQEVNNFHKDILYNAYLYLAQENDITQTEATRIRKELDKKIDKVNNMYSLLKTAKILCIERATPHVFIETELNYKPRRKS